MAQEVGEFPPVNRGRTSKYNWERYNNGKIWKLVPGDDYEVKETSLRQSAAHFAKSNGLTLKSRVEMSEDKKITAVYIQFVPNGKATAKAKAATAAGAATK